MTNEIYKEQEEVQEVVHINTRTRPMFKEMLNSIGSEIKVGKNRLKYGDAVYQLDIEEFNSLFNRWVTVCCDKNIMRKTLSTDSEKYLKWSEELSDVERAYRSLEVLKEIL